MRKETTLTIEGSWTRTNRIRIDNPPSEMPRPPRAVVRRQGLLGGLNPLDRTHEERLREAYYLAEESAYVDRGMASLSVYGRHVITKAVSDMEQMDRELPVGSLAQEVGETLTQLGAQLMAEAHVAISQNYIQTSIARLRRT
jgi:hypothetical protein